jgi:hypothetical protein
MRTTTHARAILPLIVATLLASPMSAQTHEHPAAADTPSPDAQKAFTLIKSLAGAWQGKVTVDPASKLSDKNDKNDKMDITLRVTSRGNAVVHEMKAADATDNPVKNDHPVTMMYLDGGNLVLTHYCDAGNRPRMGARISPDGKQVDFDFIDVAGPTTYGHMQHVRLTVIDDTHHREDWTYATPDGKTVTGHMDLERVSTVASNTAK